MKSPEDLTAFSLMWGQEELRLIKVGNFTMAMPKEEMLHESTLLILPRYTEIRARRNKVAISRLTHYLETSHPAHKIRSYPGIPSMIHELSYELFGRETHIYDEGLTFNPPHLPDIVNFCLERFDWNITPEASKLLGVR